MTRWDKYLIIFVLIASLLGLYYVKNAFVDNGIKQVKIEVDGDVYKKIRFDSIKNNRFIEIKTKFGYNKVEISDDKVRVVEADCPDKLDVKQGWIERPGEVIVCLPNRLVIQIVSEEEVEEEYDYISY
ncbi:NusG domain II-containing protein [Dethiothermospora halolimnae]|uniref:NusG domain II-containing protein n=1 Tax=Dethiothermospora halolimnae TaxID=3114390 RepID=UPI003CCBB45A